MIILVAPSGAGKSTFLEQILQEEPRLVDVVTYTTRQMREGEREGGTYHFVSHDEFIQLRDQGFFIEWARVHSNLYGTPIDQIERAWAKGLAVIMDLDVQGARTCKKKFPQAKTIFIMPPSVEELRRRVLGRNRQPPPDFELRMENALKEMSQAKEFDVQLINNQFQASYDEFKKIIEEILKEE